VNAPKLAFKAYSKPSSGKHAGKDVRPTTHEVLLQSSQHPRLDYTAAPSSLDQHLSHYIAVFDPASKKLDITPAHHLNLRSALRSEAVEEDQDKLSYAKQREELGREFGTKKARKAIASKTENAITNPNDKGKGKVTDVQTAILDNVADATTGATTSQKAEQDADAMLAAKPIPKPNVTASSVEEVYPLKTLIPANDMRLIPTKDWQDKNRAGEDIQFKHRFPAFRLSPIVKSGDNSKLSALRYLTLLLEFHDSLASAGRAAAKKVPKKDILAKKLEGWPPALVDTVRKRFTNESGSELAKWHLDNLYTHICALSLYIDDWVTDTSHLKDDLKLETKVISQYFLELGCKVAAPSEGERTRLNLGKAQAKVTRMAKLKLPLEFPKPRVGRRT
jgi:DNA-directed RNA polymerase I subunit RPA49